jgi:hypothetical protein
VDCDEEIFVSYRREEPLPEPGMAAIRDLAL